VNWIHLAKGRKQWRVVVNTVMNLLVFSKRLDILRLPERLSASRREL
jgi:hypothetical protein